MWTLVYHHTFTARSMSQIGISSPKESGAYNNVVIMSHSTRIRKGEEKKRLYIHREAPYIATTPYPYINIGSKATAPTKWFPRFGHLVEKKFRIRIELIVCKIVFLSPHNLFSFYIPLEFLAKGSVAVHEHAFKATAPHIVVVFQLKLDANIGVFTFLNKQIG